MNSPANHMRKIIILLGIGALVFAPWSASVAAASRCLAPCCQPFKQSPVPAHLLQELKPFTGCCAGSAHIPCKIKKGGAFHFQLGALSQLMKKEVRPSKQGTTFTHATALHYPAMKGCQALFKTIPRNRSAPIYLQTFALLI